MPAVHPMPVFDTHKAVKALCHAGFDDAQAEAVVEQINDAVNQSVATKTDMDRLATNEDFERFAPRYDLQDHLRHLATKDDLECLLTKEDLAEQTRTILRYALGFGVLTVALIKVLDVVIG